MPKNQCVVKLTDEDRTTVLNLSKKGTIATRKLARAHILRLANVGRQDAEITESAGVGLSTMERTQKK